VCLTSSREGLPSDAMPIAGQIHPPQRLRRHTPCAQTMTSIPLSARASEKYQSPVSWHAKMPINPNEQWSSPLFSSAGAYYSSPNFSQVGNDRTNTILAPLRLLLRMESVATCTPPTSSCSTTINQLLHNVHSRKDLIKELLADNDFHREIVESLDSIKPSILNQASYNNSIVDWKDTARHYPVDKNVFSVYSYGTRIGQPQPSSKSAAKAKGYAKRKVI
jgi:hypothetical protein